MNIRLTGCGLVCGSRNNTLGDKGFIGLFSSKLLGGFDGEIDGGLLRHAVNAHEALVLATSCIALDEGPNHFESDFPAVFLSPVNEFALVVPVGGCNGFHVEIGAKDTVDENTARKFVALVNIHGAHQRLESIAANGLKPT